MSRPIITSLTWIKRNWARSIPIEYEVEENTIQDFQKIKNKAKLTGNETIKESTIKLEQGMDDLNINLNEVEMENLETVPVFCDEFKQYYGKKEEVNQEIKVEGEENVNMDQYPDEFDDISDEEQDDFTIHPSDALIACTTAQEDFSNIEIYIYDEKNQSLYVHHDIILSAYPLCIEWLPIKNNLKSNYVIVGSFLPEIEIWNLDVQDALEPEIVLGKTDQDEKYYKNLKKKKNSLKNKSSEDLKYVHTDAVLTLNINPFNNRILASGGADGKILIWDINSETTSKAVKSITEHKDKVQSVRWNKMEDNVLISGSFDKSIKLYDVRADTSCTTIQVSSDIECLEWSSVNKYLFISSYENGKIDLYDIRKFDTIVSFQAHKKAATSVTFSNKQEGLFVSVGSDSYVKVWDSANTSLSQDGSVAPSLLCEKFVKKTTVYYIKLNLLGRIILCKVF
jgi:periodic tryptophan protein 1